MKKLWCFGLYSNKIFEAEFEERNKSYKFLERPSCFNSIVLKINVNKFVGDFAFADTKEDLLKVINEYFDNKILFYKNKITTIENLKEDINNSSNV